MRAFLHRLVYSFVRDPHRPAIFRRSGNQGSRDENLSARRLALDAQWRPDLVHGLAPGIRFFERALGALLRTDDDLFAGYWFAHSSPGRQLLGCLDAPENQI